MAIANGTCVSFCNQPNVHFGLPWVRLHGWKEDSMLVKRIAAYTHLCSNNLRAIARYWSKIANFPTPLHLTPPLDCSHWNSGKKFGPQKTKIMGLAGSEDRLTIG